MYPRKFDRLELPNEQYHKGEGVSSSTLKEFRISPAHCRAYMEGLRSKSTASLTLGTIIHAAVLEPDVFAATYRLAPKREDYPDALATVDDMKARAAALGLTLKGKPVKADYVAAIREADPTAQFWDDINRQDDGVTYITQEQYDAAMGAVESVAKCPEARLLLNPADIEVESSFYWIDRETGELCRVRPDALNHKHRACIDLKTCQDARPEAASRAILNYSYHLSAAMYLDGLNQFQGVNDFAWIFIETAAPYAVKVYYACDRLLDHGHREYRRLLGGFSMCQASGDWPAYGDQGELIDLPAFAVRKDEDSLAA